MKKNRPIHVWIPEWRRRPGGIQRCSGYVAQALGELLPERRVRLFVKNDLPPEEAPISRNITVETTGHIEGFLRTFAFSAMVFLAVLRDRPRLIILTHANFSPLAFFVRRFFGVSYWVVAHGTEVWGRTDSKLRRGLRGSQRVLCVSRYTASRLHEELGVERFRLTPFPNTFEDERFRPSPKPPRLLKRFALRPREPVVLTVARLARSERPKGYDHVLECLPGLAERFPDIRYVIAGQGEDIPRIRDRARELGVPGRVILPGFVPEEELVDFFNLCDVFAMPSRKEGFGIVFLEALACGKPVIAGNADGSVEPLLGGRIGVLVDPDDKVALEREISAILDGSHAHPLLKKPEELRRMVVGKYGYKRFRSRLRRLLSEEGIHR